MTSNRSDNGSEPLLEDEAFETVLQSTSADGQPPSVPVWRLFQFADRLDVLLIVAGTIGALLLPGAWTSMAIFWGVLTEGLVEFARNETAPNAASDLTKAVDMFSIGIGAEVAIVFVTTFMFAFFFNLTASRQIRRIKKLYLNSALRQEMSWFDAQKMGDFTSRISGDARKVEAGLNEKLAIIIVCGLIFWQGVGIAFYYGWKLSVALCGMIPPLFLCTWFVAKFQGNASEKETAAYSEAGAVATEALGSIRTVAAFGGEEHETERYRRSLRPAQQAMVRRGLLNGVGTGLVDLLVFAGFGVAFWYGTKLVLESRQHGDEQYTAGNVSIIFFSLLFGTLALGDLGPYTEALATAKGAAAPIFEVIAQKSSLDPLDPEGDRPVELEGHIEFRGVCFSYPSRSDVPVLKSISFSVLPGQTVALVGSSGCGKTTCVQLVQRLYDPDHGTVMLDGRDLTSLNIGWLRRQTGVVSQEPVLFSGTVAENIRHGMPDATDEQVEQAARDANVWEVIERLPQGLHTPLGAGGTQLSGGQKQRIAIARALVRQPRILLLDEATASLDVHAEAAVLQAMEKARAGRTTIMIAHRLSTVRSADVIHVLDDGRLTESGSHQQLMDLKGVYHRLVNAQSLASAGEADDGETDGGGPAALSELRRRRLSSAVSHGEHVDDATADLTDQTADTEDPAALPKVSSRRLLSGNGAEWPYITLGVITSAFLGFVTPGFAFVYSYMLKNFSEEDPEVALSMAQMWALVITGLGLYILIMETLQNWAFSVSGERLTTRLRIGLFSSLLHQELSFHDQTKHSVGALTSWLSEDAAKVQAASGIRLGQLAKSLFTLAVGASISFLLSWRVSLAVIAFVPISGVCAALEHRVNEDRDEEERTEHQQANQVAVEAVSNIRTVAAYGMEEAVSHRFEQILDGGKRRELKRAATRGLMMAISEAIPPLENIILFQVGKLELLNGRTTYPVLFMISETLLIAVVRMSATFVFSEDFSSALLAARRVFAMIDRVPAIDVRKSAGETVEVNVDGVKSGRSSGRAVDSARYRLLESQRGMGSTEDVDAMDVDIRQPRVTRDESSRQRPQSTNVVHPEVAGNDWLTDDDPRVNVNGGPETSVTQSDTRNTDTRTHYEDTSGDAATSDHIALDKVSFRYPNRPQVQVLRDLDLEVAPGQTVALVGASGCGKSTCVQLLQRFYDPDEGAVVVGGRKLVSVNLRAHRASLGVVSQEPVLFNRTIRENIAYGDTSRDVSMDEIMSAARSANIHEFITSLPAGYDTILGSSSRTQLSGGQKQRIAIARALLRRPEVLLLDEATSALDTESERCVQEALDRAASNRTCLVIAHRLSTIQAADWIFVMHRGQVVEQGTHQQLLALRGRYFLMCTAAS